MHAHTGTRTHTRAHAQLAKYTQKCGDSALDVTIYGIISYFVPRSSFKHQR